jgi:hypothetical protein
VSFNLNMPATPVVVGGEFIFSYLINNQAATTLTGLAFDDYVALRYELLAVQQTTCPATVELDPGNLGSTVRMRNGALASGATCQITIKAKVRTGTPPSVYTEALDQPLTSHEAYPVAGNTTSLTVKAQQVITFAPLPDHTYGDAPFAMNATASSGLPVSFSSNTPAICTVAGNTVTLVGAGSMCQITAQQAGDAQYMPAAATKQFFVAKRSQTITFAALADKVLGAAPFAVSAASSAGLPVSFASTTPAVCTMAGATVTLVSAGTCAIVASQAGNANTLAAASVTRQFAVTNPAKQNQTISFAALGDKALGAAPFAVSATASSGLPVSFASNTPGVCTTAGNTVTLVAAGTCTIAATQGGNNVYNPAPPMARSFVVQNASGPVLAQKIFLPVVTR